MITDVFEKPADEEPSRLYGGLAIALGFTAMTGGALLYRKGIDPMGLDKPVAWSGFAPLIRGAIECLQTIE